MKFDNAAMHVGITSQVYNYKYIEYPKGGMVRYFKPKVMPDNDGLGLLQTPDFSKKTAKKYGNLDVTVLRVSIKNLGIKSFTKISNFFYNHRIVYKSDHLI